MRRDRVRSWLVGLCIAGVVGFAAVIGTHAGRVGSRALLLLPEIFEGAPARPLLWLTSAPQRESFGFTYSAGEVKGDLYLPADGGRHGAVILLLGARPAPRDDPTLTRFAEGLGRAGAIVMVSESSNLSAGLVLAEEVDAVVGQVELLRARPDVDKARIAIIGFSVGGSVGLLAAQDDRLRGRLAAINLFGSYYDATDVVRAAASRSLAYAGLDQGWAPDGTTIWVLARQLIDTLPSESDRETLDRIYVQSDSAARAEVSLLSPQGHAVVDLLDGAAPQRVDELLGSLPDASRARLRAISPSTAMRRTHTPLYVMHDLSDSLIPFTESRRLVANAPPQMVALVTEFELFAHVVPDARGGELEFAGELAKLARHVYALLNTFL